jgi:hypothetical protein
MRAYKILCLLDSKLKEGRMIEEIKHTLPWHADTPENDTMKLIHDKNCNTIIWDDTITDEYVQFILKAVNNHYKLVKICKRMGKFLDIMEPYYEENCDTCEFKKEVEQALKDVEEK